MRSRRNNMALRSFPGTSAVQCLVLLLASADFFVFVQGDCKDFDFEKGMGMLSKWTKTGHAFDNQPTYRDNPNARNPRIRTNVQGDWWIGTFENRSNPTAEAGYVEGDFPIGTLTSPKFRINGSNINFLFGGGCDGEEIRVELLVNGKPQRVAFADNCRERMRRRVWNVAEFKNQIGQIRLVDGSRKGHVNFDDLRGDFTCDDTETRLLGSTITDSGLKGEVIVVDDPLDFSNQSDSDKKHHGRPIIGTEDEYNTIHNSSISHLEDEPIRTGKVHKVAHNFSQLQGQDWPIKIGKGTPQHKGLLGEAKANDRPSLKASPQLSKVFTAAKILKAPVAKLSAKLPHKDSANNSLLPKDDELRNLTCKNFLVKIKTGLPWDNDFLFESNGNYQSTRREMEVKVLDAYEDDKDFRGAFFSKFSSSEEPGELKAFFVLRFRASGKFLGKLLDKLGDGNVSAAGCFEDAPVVQCPSTCPSTCAPLCQASCCQPSVSVVAAPQPVYQPAPMPPPPPQPVPAMVPIPQVYQPQTQQGNQQLPVQAPAAQSPSQFPMSQPMSWPGSQCAPGCSPNCAPGCSPTCCHFFNYKRAKTNIKSVLKKQRLEEEKH